MKKIKFCSIELELVQSISLTTHFSPVKNFEGERFEKRV